MQTEMVISYNRKNKSYKLVAKQGEFKHVLLAKTVKQIEQYLPIIHLELYAAEFFNLIFCNGKEKDKPRLLGREG